MRPRVHCWKRSSLHIFSLDHFFLSHGFHFYADKFYICISISQCLSELKLHFCAHVPMTCEGLNSIFASLHASRQTLCPAFWPQRQWCEADPHFYVPKENKVALQILGKLERNGVKWGERKEGDNSNNKSISFASGITFNQCSPLQTCNCFYWGTFKNRIEAQF